MGAANDDTTDVAITPVQRLENVPSYCEFLDSYLKPNRPVIIGRGLAKDWPAFHLEKKGANRFDYILTRYA